MESKASTVPSSQIKDIFGFKTESLDISVDTILGKYFPLFRALLKCITANLDFQISDVAFLQMQQTFAF